MLDLARRREPLCVCLWAAYRNRLDGRRSGAHRDGPTTRHLCRTRASRKQPLPTRPKTSIKPGCRPPDPGLRPRDLGDEHRPADVQALDGERRSRPGPPALDRHPEPLGLARDALWGEASRARSPRSRAIARRRSRQRCRGTPRLGDPRSQSVEREGQAPRRASPCRSRDPGTPRPSQDPVATVRNTANRSACDRLRTDRAPSSSIIGSGTSRRASRAREASSGAAGSRVRSAGLGTVDQAIPNGISPGGWMPRSRQPSAPRGRSSVGQAKDQAFGAQPQSEQRPGGASAVHRGSHGRPTVHSAHGCCRDDGRLFREAERG